MERKKQQKQGVSKGEFYYCLGFAPGLEKNILKDVSELE